MRQSLEMLNVFDTLTLKQNFVRTKKLFQKTGEQLLS